MKTGLAILLVAFVATLPAQAGLVQIEMTGSIEYNQVRPPASFNRDIVKAGDLVTVSFRVDSEVYLDSSFFPTRGYAVIPDSYTITFHAATGPVVEPLRDPAPSGFTPYFVVRNNDPAVDGFFVSTGSVDFPFEYLWIDEPARLAPFFQQTFEVSYPQERLPSLDIYDAVGLYDFDGLSSYYFTILDGFADAMSIAFSQMTIGRVPVEVPIDFKPGSCPNPLNVRSQGVLPVAILGTETLDVMNIDPASIRLNGVPALHSALEDVGAPFHPFVGRTDCTWDCGESGPDGWLDLTLKFETQAVAATFGDVGDGQCMVLRLTGNFNEAYDAAGPIVGEDVARILNRGRPITRPLPAPQEDRITRTAIPRPGETTRPIDLGRRD